MLEDRVHLRDPFDYLCGISWSAIGSGAYHTELSDMKNPDTWSKLQRYIKLNYILRLLDTVIGNC